MIPSCVLEAQCVIIEVSTVTDTFTTDTLTLTATVTSTVTITTFQPLSVNTVTLDDEQCCTEGDRY